MSAERSTERLVFFTDAVVAIALTLLILPLTEVVGEVVAEGGHAVEVVTHHQWQIYSFLLSFVVIARLWTVHHRIFESVKAYNRPLMAVNQLWLLTVVVLPFPTQLVGGFQTERFTVLFYIGTIFVGSLCQLGLLLIVRHDPEVARAPISDRRVANSVGTSIVIAVALVVGAIAPQFGYFALLLLFLPHLVANRFSDTTVATA